MPPSRRSTAAERLNMWRCVWERYTRPGITQKEIAGFLGMSESKVSRVLSRAEKEGMMKVTVEVIPPRIAELERGLRERFELFDAVVIPSIGDEQRGIKRSVGIAAARYFEWLVKEGSRIAVAAGTTLTQMVDSLTPRRFRDIRLYPMAAMELGLKANAAKVVEFFPNALVASMRAKYGGNVQAFTFQIAPVEKRGLNEREKLEILERNGIGDLFREALNADVFLVEIGSFKHIDQRAEAVLRYYNTDIAELKRLSQGQINFQAFDSEHVLTEEFPGLNDIIAVSLSHLKQMSRTPGKHVIAVSAGPDAVEATIASLSPNIRCYDILVTDETVAGNVLSAV